MGNKVKLITPFLMLLAGAVASIIMYIRDFEFERMLWILLTVLIVFYIIGDIVRYIYAAIRPRIISRDADVYSDFIPLSRFAEESGKVRAYADEGGEENEEFDADAFFASAKGEAENDSSENADNEGYSDEDLQEYSSEYIEEDEAEYDE